MGVLEDVQKMRSEGRSESDIAQALQQQGISPQEVYESMQQATIKNAVTSEPQYQDSAQMGQESQQEQTQQQYDYAQQQGYDQSQQNYQQQSYSGGLSAETIAEIAEQAITEKLSLLKGDLEKILDFKTSADAKIEMLDERLKRIEKILDRLQLSILQKVGEYMTNVDDLKKELIETQKTFSAVTSSPKSKPAAHKESKEE